MTLQNLTTVAALTAAALCAPVAPANADTCVDDSIAQCDKRYPPGSYHNLWIRGWCYIILIAGCPTADVT